MNSRRLHKVVLQSLL